MFNLYPSFHIQKIPMAGPSKQQKIMTVSIVILLDDALGKKIHKKKKIQEILGA